MRRISLLFLIMLLAACGSDDKKSTSQSGEDSAEAASTLFAAPTRVISITLTPTPASELEIALNRTIAHMEAAALRGDPDSYMQNIWDGDPTFWIEQLRWAQDWQEYRLDHFDLTLHGIQELSPTTAEARMAVLWSQSNSSGQVGEDGEAGGTTVSVIFYKDGSRWLYGGENWKTIESDGIRLDYFSNAIIDNQLQANAVVEYLPGVYNQITREFDFVPQQPAEIKIYETSPMLQTMTRLSMPQLELWNEPGESIKVTLGPSNIPPLEVDIAREYTRYVLFQIGGNPQGGSHGGFPWWLEDGIAEYGSSLFRTLSQRNRIIKSVAARAIANTEEQRLEDWVNLSDPGSADYSAGVAQSYTLILYISETHGKEARNAWIKAIAGGQSVEDATQEHLGVSFADLDAAWREWLPTQV